MVARYVSSFLLDDKVLMPNRSKIQSAQRKLWRPTKKEPLSMEHIKRVLDISNTFDRDLKGDLVLRMLCVATFSPLQLVPP